ANERAHFVAHRLDHDARPKSALVAAHTPTLDGVFALVCGDLEGPSRFAGLLLFLGIKSTEVPADDFRRRILMDALRTHVPVGDTSIPIKHEDGIVGDSLDDSPKAPFAFHERLLRLASLGNVVLEGVLDSFALLDLGMKRRSALLDRVQHFPLLTQQLLFGAATGGDILGDCHQVMHGSALVEDGGNIGSDPRFIGRHGLVLDSDALASTDGMTEQIEHPGTIIGVDEIADPRLQQACRRSMNDVAITTVDEPETSRRIDLSDAHVGMAQQGPEILLLERQLGSDTL